MATEWLDAATLVAQLDADGPLQADYFNLETVLSLDAQVWGQAFEAPVFSDEVECWSQRPWWAKAPEALGCAMASPCATHLVRPHRAGGNTVTLAYQLRVDEYNGRSVCR